MNKLEEIIGDLQSHQFETINELNPTKVDEDNYKILLFLRSDNSAKVHIVNHIEYKQYRDYLSSKKKND